MCRIGLEEGQILRPGPTVRIEDVVTLGQLVVELDGGGGPASALDNLYIAKLFNFLQYPLFRHV